MESKILPIVSAFTPVVDKPVYNPTPVSDVDIVETLIIETYDVDDEKHVTPVTKQIEVKRYNRKDYIESFSEEVGLRNILEKIGVGAIAEDKYSILKSQNPGDVTDLRGLSDINNYGDVVKLAEKAKNTWNGLDPALKKDMTFQKFVESFNNQDLNDYVKAKVDFLKEQKDVEKGAKE